MNVKMFASMVLAGLLTATSAIAYSDQAHAEMNCRIRMEIGKVGFVVGFSGGKGTLTCNGQSYALEVGGMSAGLVIGGSRISLVGEVRTLHRIGDVVARNQNGVQLVMRGRQAGLEASLDLGGTRIKLRR